MADEDPEFEELRAASAAIGAAMASGREPLCVAHAFRSPRLESLQFTMQRWVDLIAIRSPLLDGELPATIQELEAAAAVFGLEVEESITAEEAVNAAMRLRKVITDGFALALPMRPEGAPDSNEEDGFGNWLPTFSCLITQCRLALFEARALQVREAFALIAAMRRNQGWHVAGTPYTQRDLIAAAEEAV